jgi:hypothetical protein
MGRRHKYVTPEIAKKFAKQDYLVLDGFEIRSGDLFKVRGEYGARFKFQFLVTNIETGAQWVDCFEVISGTPSIYRSFKTDKIKRIPIRKKRAKRVI